MITIATQINQRFRGYLPVVVDVETGGFNASTDALLEIALVIIGLDTDNKLVPQEHSACHVKPFDGANLDPKSLAFNGIVPESPLRGALEEKAALEHCLTPVRKAVGKVGCTRAILVGHNASFDLSFINAAVERTGYKRNPFHPFSTIDTVSLAALGIGHTVLAEALKRCGIDWDEREAHSAIYDADKTAQLFCHLVNQWDRLSGLSAWRS